MDSWTTHPSSGVRIPIEHGSLAGDLTVPRGARGVVVFVHGSGSDRTSPRNRTVADALEQAGFATLLVDLLTADEAVLDAADGELRFDIGLLTRRVGAIARWAAADRRMRHLPVGLFGASTGAAAALAVAALAPDTIGAVVSRGGRPDLATTLLEHVRAPTLLIVGSRDTRTMERNRAAAAQLTCEHHLAVVPGATHLFDEPGTIERAAELTATWFQRHLERRSPSRRPFFERPSAATERRIARRVQRSGPYADRGEAGRELAQAVADRSLQLVDPIVLAVPRGGIEVALPVGDELMAPVDVVVVRRLGTPIQPELALGAVDEDGDLVVDDELQHALGLGTGDVEVLATATFREVRRRARVLRDNRPPVDVTGRDVVLVDDGFATGMTAVSAARYLRRHGARAIVLAVPVAPNTLQQHAPPDFDHVVCPWMPEPFGAVSRHYRSFPQLTDDDVRMLLGSVQRQPAWLASRRDMPGVRTDRR